MVLNLLIFVNLRILNGRLPDTDKFTFITQQGASLIDYLLTKESNFSRINSFTVEDLNVYSDHTPIIFSIHANFDYPEGISENYVKIQWDVSKRDKFRSAIISRLTELNNLTCSHSSNLQNREYINTLHNSFTIIIREVADPLFLNHSSHKNVSYNDAAHVKHADWFDNECVQAKNIYLQALRNFNFCKTTESRHLLCAQKANYKSLINKKKRLFENNKLCELEKLKHAKPREFWKHFKNNKSRKSNNISNDDFFKYFSTLSNDISQCSNDEAEQFCRTNDFNNCDVSFPELDKPITTDEIVNAVMFLKSRKSCGYDNLLNEYFMESVDIIGSHLCDIFNAILNSGYFPDKWTEGIIVPIHKKGGYGKC